MKRVIVLTGANRGIGRKTAEILVQNYSKNNIFVFTQRGKNDDLKNALQKINPSAEFEIQQLDVVDKDSRKILVNWLKQKYGRVDVLYNNAGVFDYSESFEKRSSKKVAQYILQTNFISTIELTEEVYPLLSNDGKIILTSSQYSKLSMQPEAGRDILSNEKIITKEKLFKLADDYIQNVEDPSKSIIFNTFSYCLSKALINAYVRFIAQKYIKPNQSVFAVDPGWVKTDMGGQNALFTTDQACPYLAVLVAEFPYGRHPLSGKFIFQNQLTEF